MSKESPVKVSLDLNEELREYAVKRLAQFRTEHRDCATNVLCDLPQLNRELCGAVCNHLNAIQYYGMKKKTADLCVTLLACKLISFVVLGGLLIIYQLTIRRIMNVLNMIIERIGLLILLVHSYSHGLIRL